MQYTLGVDIGGTFTDFSLIDAEGKITLWKEASTPKDSKQAIIKGLMLCLKTRSYPYLISLAGWIYSCTDKQSLLIPLSEMGLKRLFYVPKDLET